MTKPIKGSWPQSAYPRTCELLASLGIDPARVLEDGITATGYDEIALDKSGKRTVAPNGGWARIQREWPDLETGQQVIALLAEDRRNYRWPTG